MKQLLVVIGILSLAVGCSKSATKSAAEAAEGLTDDASGDTDAGTDGIVDIKTGKKSAGGDDVGGDDDDDGGGGNGDGGDDSDDDAATEDDDDDGDDAASTVPVDVEATGGAQIDLSWAAVASASSYNIYRGTSAAFAAGAPHASQAGVTYTDTTALLDTEYFYRITSVVATLESAPSDEVSATRSNLPGAPSLFTGRSAEDDQVTLTWTAPTGGSAPTGYHIFRSTTPDVDTTGTPYAAVAVVATHVDAAVTNGTTYYYAIVAVNAAGASPAANEVEATPWDPAAPFNANVVFLQAGAAGTGTLAAPFGTLADAYTAAASGGHVIVLDGSIDLAGVAALSLAKPVTIRSATGHHASSAALFTDSSTGADRSAFQVNSSDVVIKGLRFTSFENNTSSGTIYFPASAAISDISIANNHFSGGTATSIFKTTGLADATAVTITGNLIEDIIVAGDRDGIRFYGADDLTISDNHIDNVTYDGILTSDITNATMSNNTVNDAKNTGIQVGPNSGPVTITGNVVSDCNSDTAGGYGGIRVYGATLIGAVTVTDNVITNSYNGFVIRNGEDITGKTITLSNNDFHGNSNAGVSHTGLGELDATNNYWGDASGPTHADNPAGTGDVVLEGAGNILFAPFLTAAP